MPTAESNLQTIIEVIFSRRTIHNFRPERVPDALLIEAIAAACAAPNHRMTEPWRFYLIGPETADAIAELNARLVAEKRSPEAAKKKLARWKQMAGWLLVTCQRSADPLREQENYAACACAVQNLMLTLWSRDIGMKWGTGGVTRDPALFELLNLDAAQEFVVGLFCYGYPDEVPLMKPRQPVEQVIRYLP